MHAPVCISNTPPQMARALRHPETGKNNEIKTLKPIREGGISQNKCEKAEDQHVLKTRTVQWLKTTNIMENRDIMKQKYENTHSDHSDTHAIIEKWVLSSAGSTHARAHAPPRARPGSCLPR